MRSNPMPTPAKLCSEGSTGTTSRTSSTAQSSSLGVAAFLLLGMMSSGCDDNNLTAQPSCGTHNLTRYIMTVTEVRQHCIVTEETLKKRTCNNGSTPLSNKDSAVMFETTVSGRILAVRIDPPGGTRVGQAHKAKDGLNWTATIVAADEALFSRAQVDDTVALCPWHDQKYAYELPDMGMLSKLWEEEPSSAAKEELPFPSTIGEDTPTCDQPPCPTEGEGEGEGVTATPPFEPAGANCRCNLKQCPEPCLMDMCPGDCTPYLLSYLKQSRTPPPLDATLQFPSPSNP